MKSTAVVTIVSMNYFAFAKNLAYSYKKNNPGDDFYILIVDKITEFEKIKDDKYSIIDINELNISNLHDLAFKYDIVELNTAVKPFFIEYLFSNYNYENVIYLDPDIMVFNNFDFIKNILTKESIVLTPHILYESYDSGTLKDNEFLKNGIFNLGFIAFKNNINSKRMLNWWKEKLEIYCYKDYLNGLAWDQKWIDFVPTLFDEVYILKHPGHNVAHWNIHERNISVVNNIFKVNDKYDLIFFHFSNYKINNPEYIVNVPNYFVNEPVQLKVSDRKDLSELYSIYHNEVLKCGYDEFSRVKYFYSCFDNGITIKNIYRKLYAGLKDSYHFDSNPFCTTKNNSFYIWLCKEKYINRENKSCNLTEKVSATNVNQIMMTLKLFKLLRKVLGVTKYISLLKKAVWVSNIDNHYILYNKLNEDNEK